MAIVMNVGPSAISAAGGASGGGQTLGAAQGTITINVQNVTQANSLLQNSAKQMQQAFNATGQAARLASTQQIAAARSAAASASSLATQTVSANRVIGSGAQLAATQNQAASKSIIASNNVLASSYKLSATQGTIASNSVIQSLRQQAQQARTSAAQQATAHKATIQPLQQQAIAARNSAAAQTQAHRSVMQPLQQNIAANRLVISNLALQAAQARATARAQRQAAQQSVTGWQQFNNQLDQIQTQLVVVGAGAALLAGSGIGYAASMEEARIQLEGMTGSEEKAVALMEKLREQGKATSLPFQQMLTFAVQLLPVLNRNTDELEKWFDIVRRTAVLNRGPTGGIAGATFSLREAFLSVQQGGRDFVSLADRFNISKLALQEALEVSGGDFVKAMDLVLNQMGVTTEAADKMALTFNAGLILAKDAALQLIAQGFTPLINILGPLLQKAADLTGILAEWAPELVTVGAGFITLVAVGTPLLLLISQLTVAWATMGATAQGAILKMSRIGGIAAGAATGVAIGRSIGIALGGAIRTSQGKDPFTQEQLNQNITDYLFLRFAELRQAGDDLYQGLVYVQTSILDGVAAIQRGVQSIYQNLADATNIPFLKNQLQKGALNSGTAAFNTENEASRLRSEAATAATKMYQELITLAQRWNVTGYDPTSGSGAAGRSSSITDDQRTAIMEWNRDLIQLEKETGRARVEAVQEYQDRIEDTIRQYNLNQTRQEEDYQRGRANSERRYNLERLQAIEDSARQRARWEEDLARSIEQARESSAERIRDMQEDHDRESQDRINDSLEREAELRKDRSKKQEDDQKDYNKRLAELEEDFQKDRQKSLEESMKAQIRAASQFDAIALYREQQKFMDEDKEARQAYADRLAKEQENFNASNEEANESYREKLEDERKSLAKSQRQANEAHQRSLEQEAKNLQDSIDQQNEAHALQLERAAEDDARRLEDMEQAFREQQDQEQLEYEIRLQRQREDHEAQLLEMADDHQKKLEQIEQNYLDELEVINTAFDDRMAALDLYHANYVEKENAFFNASYEKYKAYVKSLEDLIPGPLPKNPFITEGGWPTLGGGGNQQSSGSFGTNGGTQNNVSVVISPSAVQIFPNAGQNAADIGAEVVRQIGNLLVKLVPGRGF